MLSNRGANGIDGVVSTAVGVALSGVPTVLLIGDVAFLHDTNGLLGLDARGVDAAGGRHAFVQRHRLGQRGQGRGGASRPVRRRVPGGDAR